MKVACVIGAATRPGRLAKAVGALAALAESQEGCDGVRTVDLASQRVEICDGRPPEDYNADTREAVGSIEEADVVLIASPVYRATYPGVLKNLLDHLPVDALRNKPVGIVAMGASDHHFLGVDSQLRFVLAWFGAIALPNSVYLTNADFKDGELSSDSAKADLRDLAAAALEVASKLQGTNLGPTPLAAKPW